jgi:ribosomal protein S18 acetylase RimI-like enzyme
MMSNQSVRIREAGPKDLEAILGFNIAMALETENKHLDPATARRGVETALRQPELAEYFLAEQDGRVVGQCMITYEWSDWRAATFWWIQSVYVLPEYRGRGVFKSLYEQVTERARASGTSCGVRLYVEEHNAPAIATYRKLGMKPSGHMVYEVDWSS